VDNQTPDRDTFISARRRLVRGVFAAPAALTLYSGSVAARSVQNCVASQVTNSPDLPGTPTDSMGSTYVRVQLQKFRGYNGATLLTNRYSRWIRGSDVVALQASGRTVYLSGTQWQLYDRGITDLTTDCSTNFNPASAYAGQAPGTILSSTPSEVGSVGCSGSPGTVNVTGDQVADQWVALRVDVNGNIIGVAGIGDGNGTSAISQSCWTSFKV